MMTTNFLPGQKRVSLARWFILANLASCALAGSSRATDPIAGDVGTPLTDSGWTMSLARPKPQLGGATQFFDHGNPTASDQCMIEIINRARANPAGEATRLGIDLNQGLNPGTISSTPKQPLALHPSPIQSARSHSQWMLDTDTFSHAGANGNNAYDRMVAAGYIFGGNWMVGENLAWRGTTGALPVNEYVVTMQDNLFKSPTHRENILEDRFDEIGIGLIEGVFSTGGQNYNTLMCTQNYATSESTPGPLVLGVIYRDANANDFYDPGEGLPGVTVTPSTGGYYTISSSSGGYAVPYSGNGTLWITFSGGSLAAPVSKSLVTTGTNLKLDLEVSQMAQFVRNTARWSPANGYQARISGASGLQVTVEYSANLTTWQSLGTFTLVNGVYDFQDRNATTNPPRFYRLR